MDESRVHHRHGVSFPRLTEVCTENNVTPVSDHAVKSEETFLYIQISDSVSVSVRTVCV